MIDPEHIRDQGAQFDLERLTEDGADSVLFVRDDSGDWYARVTVSLPGGYGYSWHQVTDDAITEQIQTVIDAQARKW